MELDKILKSMKNMKGLCWRGFQSAKVKFYRDGEGVRDVLRMGSCSINI